MSERTVTVAEAAKALGVTEKAVRRRIERGVLPSVLADGKRRIPAAALGLDSTGEGGAARSGSGDLPAPRVRPPVPGDVLDRLERLARENGQLRQIEAIAGQTQDELVRARARILELEAKLAERPARRRFWQR